MPKIATDAQIIVFICVSVAIKSVFFLYFYEKFMKEKK